MKFYYNGKLMRTSKTHNYTHAVIYNGNCLACSGTLEGAQKVITSEINRLGKQVETQRNILAALEKGEKHYYGYNGNKRERRTIDKSYHTVELANSNIDYFTKQLEITKQWNVVELEAR